MRMNPLLVVAALAYGAVGLTLTFAPAEVLAALHGPTPAIGVWIAQMLGAALLALAMLNHLQRYSVVGGIFGRPILLANLCLLSVSFFASLNAWRHEGGLPYLSVALVAGVLALAFGSRLFVRAAARSAPTRRDPVLPGVNSRMS